MRLRLFILCLLTPLRLLAATYYVDFDTGLDSNVGTTTGAAWKHCPGDDNATGTAAAATLAGGDTVIFKGGVAYRGVVNINWSGSGTSYITYDGNQAGTWGTGRAIMDGTIAISTTWTNCESAAACGDNPNFANIWFTDIPSGVTNGWPQMLMDGETQTFTAQEPNPSNRYLFDLVSTWIVSPLASASSTSITNATYFSQSSATYWEGAWVGVWAQANSMKYKPITNFITASDAIQFPTVSIYTDRDGYFSLFNHVSLIDQAGEHAVATNQNRLYLWPPDSANPAGHTWSIAQRANAFIGSTKHNIKIQGFDVRGYFADVDAVGYGACAIQFSGTESTNLTVLNINARHLRSMDRDWLFTVPNASGRTIMSNTIAQSYGGGIYTGGAGIVVFSNHLSQLTGTAIYAPSTTNGIISSNYLSDIVGTHANGITLYTHAESTKVWHNFIRNVYAPITYQNSHNLSFAGNVVDAYGLDQRINSWGGNDGTFQWINNTLANSSGDLLLNIGTDGTNVYQLLVNNVIDGGGSFAGMRGARTNNIYTGLAWYQTAGYGWALENGETQGTDAALFVSGSDFRPNESSALIAGGVSVSAYGYTSDLLGTAITGAPNVGAYQSSSSILPGNVVVFTTGAGTQKPGGMR